MKVWETGRIREAKTDRPRSLGKGIGWSNWFCPLRDCRDLTVITNHIHQRLEASIELSNLDRGVTAIQGRPEKGTSRQDRF